MTKFATTPGSTTDAESRAVPAALLSLMAGRAGIAQRFSHFMNSFHEEGCLEIRLLELCRARIDALHGVQGRSTLDAKTSQLINQGSFSSLASIEQRAVAVAEQLALDAHGVTDIQVAELTAELGEAATVSLLTAASMHDATIRLHKTLHSLAKPSYEET